MPLLLRVFTLLSVSACASRLIAAGPARLTLDAALDRVISSDQTIAIADLEVRKAQVDQARALSRIFPQVSLGGDASWRGNRTKSEGGGSSSSDSFGEIARESRWSRTHSSARSVGASFNQPLLDMTVGPARRQTEFGRQITEWQLRLRVREVLFGVTRQYLDAIRQERLVEEGHKTLGLTSEQVRQAEARFRAEEVIQSDVLRARVDDERARRAVMDSEHRLALSRATLAIMLNYPPTAIFQLSEPARGRAAADSLVTAVAAAREQREDVRVARLSLHRTQAERAEIRARYAPTVDLQLGRDLSFGSSIDRSESWTAGVALNWNIFDRGQRALDLKTNEFQLDQNGLQIQETLRTVTQDVSGAWYEADRLRQTVISLDIERRSAEANLKVQQGTYAAGLATSLEVQFAIRDVATARANHVSSTYELEIAWRDLESALAVYESRRIDLAMQRLLVNRTDSPPPLPLPVP